MSRLSVNGILELVRRKELVEKAGGRILAGLGLNEARGGS